jgi:hypothetical protein
METLGRSGIVKPGPIKVPSVRTYKYAFALCLASDLEDVTSAMEVVNVTRLELECAEVQ